MQTELVATGELKRALEALLFVASESLSIDALVKLTGASHVEIAAVLNVHVNTVANRLHAARSMLERLLRQHQQGLALGTNS